MLIKIAPDREKAKSIIGLVENREEFVSSIKDAKFATIAVEGHYEIIKELATALLLLDGFKTIGENAHKEVIESLSKYKDFEENEIRMIDDLRIKRNKSAYEGKQINPIYLENKKDRLLKITGKLKSLLNKKLSII